MRVACACRRCLQGQYQLVDVCCSRNDCHADCTGKRKLAGNQSGIVKPGKKLEDRIIFQKIYQVFILSAISF